MLLFPSPPGGWGVAGLEHLCLGWEVAPTGSILLQGALSLNGGVGKKRGVRQSLCSDPAFPVSHIFTLLWSRRGACGPPSHLSSMGSVSALAAVWHLGATLCRSQDSARRTGEC